MPRGLQFALALIVACSIGLALTQFLRSENRALDVAPVEVGLDEPTQLYQPSRNFDPESEATTQDPVPSETPEPEVANKFDLELAATAAVKILCVDGSTRARLEGVEIEVATFDERDLLERKPGPLFHATSDAQGLASLRVPRALLEIHGRDGFGRRAQASGSPTKGETFFVLELGEKRTIEVEVVDEEGRKLADIPVAVRRRDRRKGFRPTETLAQARTDARGRAGLELGDRARYWGYLPMFSGELCVELDGAFDPPVFAWLNEQAWTGLSVQLVAPPLVELVVRLETDDGSPVGAGWKVRLTPTTSAEDSWFMTALVAPVVDAEARFGFCLAEGSHFQLGAFPDRFSDLRADVQDEMVRSEDRPRKLVRMTLQRIGVRILEGRLLDTEGEPIRNEQLAYDLVVMEGYDPFVGHSGPPIASRGRLKTDEDGRFRLHNAAPGAHTLLGIFGQDSRGAGRQSWTRLAEGPRSQDLGDLRMEPSQVLLSGRLVDIFGKPCPASRLDLRGFNPAVIFNSWKDSTSIWTDEEGRFVCYEGLFRPCSSLLEISLSHPFPPGTSGGHVEIGSVDLEVRPMLPLNSEPPPGRVAGRLKTRPGQIVQEQDIRFRSDRGHLELRLSPDGTFVASGPPGEYHLRIDAQGSKLKVIEKITVKSDEETWLGDLILEPDGEFVEVEIDLGGRSVPEGLTLWINGGPFLGGSQAHVDPRGRARFWVQSLPCHIELRHEDFDDVDVTCGETSMRLTLKPRVR